MVEYDEEIIVNLLKVWDFDLASLDLKKIAHVPMHQYRVSSEDKPLLFIENLQCCIGLYAIMDGQAFAAHINPVVMRGDEFTRSDKVLHCKRVDDLKDFILRNSVSMQVSLGIILGSRPLSDNNEVMQIIYRDLSLMMNDLKSCGINFTLKKGVHPEFIIDSINEEIIYPKVPERVRK